MRCGQIADIVQVGGHLVEAAQKLVKEVSASLGTRRLQLAIRHNALLQVPPQGFADAAHLAADGVNLGWEGVHLGGGGGCHEALAGVWKGAASMIDWRSGWQVVCHLGPQIGLGQVG